MVKDHCFNVKTYAAQEHAWSWLFVLNNNKKQEANQYYMIESM